VKHDTGCVDQRAQRWTRSLVDAFHNAVENLFRISRLARRANLVDGLANCIDNQRSRMAKQKIPDFRSLEQPAHTRQIPSRVRAHLRLGCDAVGGGGGGGGGGVGRGVVGGRVVGGIVLGTGGGAFGGLGS